MEQKQHNFLYSCSTAEAETAHDPFVYEHALGLILSGSAEIWTGNGVEKYPSGTLLLMRRNQLLKIIKKETAYILPLLSLFFSTKKR